MKHRIFQALTGAMAAAMATLATFVVGIFTGPQTFRARTCDVAFGFRMGGGFPGDVNRFHPASIAAGLVDAANPFAAYGQFALFGSANNYRAIVAADQSATAIKVAGVLVRPYPTQQMTGGPTATIGAATPGQSGVADFLHSGFIVMKMKAGVTVKKGDPVFVWATATETVNIQNELQAAATTSKTVPVTNARFHGPADASGYVEVEVWPQA